MDTKKKLVTVTVATLGLTIGFSFGDADCLSDVDDESGSSTSSIVSSTAPDTSLGSSTTTSTTEIESTAGATETVSNVPDIGL